MTPKEKAKELFDKMYIVEDLMGDYPMCFETAKQCAKIAVQEILISLQMADTAYDLIPDIDYWNEVLTEIDKL